MTEQDQLVRLLASVLASGREGTLPQRLCARAREMLRVDGLVVTVLSTPDHRHVVCASDDDVVRADDVQLTLGDGPVVEAYRDGRAVLVPDLSAEAPGRWPLFGQAAAPRYAGVFAFPLQVDPGETIGVLALYRRSRGAIDNQQEAAARLVAEAFALAVLRSSGLGQDDDVVVQGDDSADVWSGSEQVVYQAVGMVVAQLHLEPFEALARLRAHAFAEGTTLDEVALEVVERRLRLE